MNCGLWTDEGEVGDLNTKVAKEAKAAKTGRTGRDEERNVEETQKVGGTNEE